MEFIELAQGLAQGLVLSGEAGTGMTRLATALVAEACRKGVEEQFFTKSSLAMMLHRSMEEGRLERNMDYLQIGGHGVR
ncbi:ATP-binding protein [Paeniglutamicibacter cryotolerans]|nr:ATP-binding protein [Paeniglutamicibacter cryotolerans]